jgi:transposase-like protein
MMPKLKYPTNLKVQAITRHFQDGEPISSICADLRVPPAVCQQWCKEVISGLPRFFDLSLKKQEQQKERRIEELKAEVARKQEVIGEIMEAFTTLKKKNGAQ